MCGVLGYIGRRSFDAAAFGRALDVMAARGPDDRGIYEEPEVLLGHRRLAIIDLSPRSQQPLLDPASGAALVFNGTIYNYPELRAELITRGHVFHSDGDTEVILRAWLQWGEACVERLHGMFAFAIWNRESLFLARIEKKRPGRVDLAQPHSSHVRTPPRRPRRPSKRTQR